MLGDRTISREKQPSEMFSEAIGFENDLAAGETISSVATAAIDLADDSDVKSAILSGAAQIGTVASDGKTFTAISTGFDVAQTIKAGTDKHRYKISIKITTSLSNIFEADILLTVMEL